MAKGGKDKGAEKGGKGTNKKGGKSGEKPEKERRAPPEKRQRGGSAKQGEVWVHNDADLLDTGINQNITTSDPNVKAKEAWTKKSTDNRIMETADGRFIIDPTKSRSDTNTLACSSVRLCLSLFLFSLPLINPPNPGSFSPLRRVGRDDEIILPTLPDIC